MSSFGKRTGLAWTLFVVSALNGCTSANGDQIDDQSPSELQSALLDAFPASIELDSPGYILRISKSGETIYNSQSGAADIEQARPITPQSVFHIASLSKQITAAALAHAIEDDLVSLEDPIGDWIPGTQKYGDELTVAHLVYMTSGLTEYTDMPGPDGRPWATFHYFTIDDAISASLTADTLRFEPGTAWQYNNINYMLLTRVVARAYDMPFRDVVRDKIFTPLGMSASLINDDITTVIPNRANAYLPRVEAVLTELENGADVSAHVGEDHVLIRRNAPHYGGSGVMTSMDDWSKWQNELLSHSVLGDAFWSLMTRRQVFEHDKTNDAFGLVHGEQFGKPTLWYSGGDIDTSTYSIAFPEAGISISCFSNNPIDSCEVKAQKAISILAAHGSL